jgi:hypothetical protein
MAPEAGIAPASPRLQRGANLSQLLREMVVQRGNAPRSLAYRASALLLSYQTISIRGFTPKRRSGRTARLTFGIGRILMLRFGL